MLFAAAAEKTERIRFGPNVTHVFLREPTLICQQVATLDELTGGRAELVVSTGNFGLLAQYGIDWAKQKPLSRLKEAIHVMRTFLDEGAITFEGDFFPYNGLYTFARPVQERIPIKMGGMKGPQSFQAAGELADGLHHALVVLARGLRLHGREHAHRRRARPAATGASSTSARGWSRSSRRTRRRPSARRASSSRSTSPRCRPSSSRVTASTPRSCAGRGGARRGRRREGRRAVQPEYAEKLSMAGTPEEVVEKIKADIQPAGVNHMVLALSDAALVKLFSGEEVAGVPDINGQLRLVAERVMPAFEPALR